MFSIQPIGYIQSCYQEKFGIPRQPNLVSEAKARINLLETFSLESVRGLQEFSHIWVIFRFHLTAEQGWHPTVRPPRLGGNQRVGVFATRSTFRPNALGLSVVSLSGIVECNGQVSLELRGADLLNGTPIIDIKPYIPYVDALPHAQAGYAQQAPLSQVKVRFALQASVQCQQKSTQWGVNMELLIRQILQQDPRPAYRTTQQDHREYGMRLYDFDLHWRYDADGIEVLDLSEGSLPHTKH
ncbi:tRNA (N6-threonylcarbamoyladenosine(37)-N6)-methyltransferase TrmO [Thiofilum flexile]|uniref:tRNA (N6-threonylcarbamoyladenosine(37)-N6)-methyltransferase TrmO n=1 Tax=Thiofilum flexile TaxID=125627 RepID=UPI000375B78E|nr:tRNA (N6-threonylcarbamoyladenosine(37)-N6)-methyltransferase TrmO [Thiofilum flexile]